MNEFKNFIGKRFGYNNTAVAVKSEVAQPKTTSTEEVSISDTPANSFFMNRFCKVN